MDVDAAGLGRADCGIEQAQAGVEHDFPAPHGTQLGRGLGTRSRLAKTLAALGRDLVGTDDQCSRMASPPPRAPWPRPGAVPWLPAPRRGSAASSTSGADGFERQLQALQQFAAVRRGRSEDKNALHGLDPKGGRHDNISPFMSREHRPVSDSLAGTVIDSLEFARSGASLRRSVALCRPAAPGGPAGLRRTAAWMFRLDGRRDAEGKSWLLLEVRSRAGICAASDVLAACGMN
jgi:hypothetical protein